MNIKVYHRIESNFGFGPVGEFPKDFEHVADVPLGWYCDMPEDIDAELNFAWRCTNSVQIPWFEDKRTIVIKEARSTSVGDIMVFEGQSKLYLVANVGFQVSDDNGKTWQKWTPAKILPK